MHLDRENGVRPGAHRVHHRRRHRAVVDAALQEVLQLLRVLRHDLREVLHVDAHHRMLLDLQTATKLALVRDRIQQVEDDLVVDLEVRAHDQKSLRAHLLDLDLLEERLVHPRGDAAELWGVRGTRHAPALAAPRLPVGEEAAVVAVQGCILQLLTKLFHERRLACEVFVLWVHRPVGPVELEGSLLPTRRARGHHGRAGRHVHGRTLCPGLLLRVERPHPHADLDEPRAARRRRRARLGQQRRRRSAARL
mmetsp:Transcript_41050/g.103081  ORF Transcript_41050/g.103081 Transcript_41050/m.103081 type:complete len:251 (+) Transcript_41050:1887-2639(+)